VKEAQSQAAVAGEIVLYQPNESIKVEVTLDEGHDTVWLNRQQMTVLFDRDVKTIGKHINNALQEELAPIKGTPNQSRQNQVVAKFATTAVDGKVFSSAAGRITC